jgi:hypothetical protein
VIGSRDVYAYWRAGGVTLRTDVVGVIPGSSGVAALASILPPPGATSVIVRTRTLLTSWSAGAVVLQYADALVVSNP